MSVQDIIRAWKDKEFRAGLSEAQRALLPDNPAGAIELMAADLEKVWGGGFNNTHGHWGCYSFKCSTVDCTYQGHTCKRCGGG